MASHRWASFFAASPMLLRFPTSHSSIGLFSRNPAQNGKCLRLLEGCDVRVIDLKGSKVFGWFDTTKTDADYQTLSFPGDRHIVRLALRHSPFTAAARKDWSSVRDAVSVPNCR